MANSPRLVKMQAIIRFKKIVITMDSHEARKFKITN